MINLATGFLVISRTARNIFAPSWSRSTSDAIRSSLASALSRDFRRMACNSVLCCLFISALVVAFRVFCCHNFNCRCFTDIAAISEQCGVSRLVVANVLPMVDSAADFNTCSTDVHLSLAVVLVFTSEMESDTAARNIARYGSFTSKSVLYRRCLDIRAFSIQPQTLNICLRSSFATSNRWSLWSSVPE